MSSLSKGCGDADDDAAGCAYLLDDREPMNGRQRACGALLQPGSSYCASHHALCHLGRGTRGERRRLREVEALASAVGGRRSRAAPNPSDRMLRRLERVIRHFL
jgi:hypothetical protein